MKEKGLSKRMARATAFMPVAAVALVTAAAGTAAGNESHPVGMDYREDVERDPSSYNPAESLPARLHLPGGLVGCITCHTERGMDTGELVMGNEKSQLCAACHRK